jgi:excisionase family DNA binding protein
MTEILLTQYGPFMDIKELATLLKVKAQTLYNQISKGLLEIPHIKRGKKYLFPTAAVADYLDSRLVFA